MVLYPKLILLYYCFITGTTTRSTDAFTSPHTTTIKSAATFRPRSITEPKRRRLRSDALPLPLGTTMSDRCSSSKKMTYADEAEQLIELLVGRHNNDDGGQIDSEDENADIERLMQSLEDARLPFDPQTSLNGPLFAALYQKGTAVPFWEKYSRFRSKDRKNIKGQRYVTVNRDREGRGDIGDEEEDTYDLTNYAEFFGEGK